MTIHKKYAWSSATSRRVFTPQTLSLCDGAVYIPMYGKGPSMNVHVAGALVAYRALMGRR